jgi:hypothetical protein
MAAATLGHVHGAAAAHADHRRAGLLACKAGQLDGRLEQGLADNGIEDAGLISAGGQRALDGIDHTELGDFAVGHEQHPSGLDLPAFQEIGQLGRRPVPQHDLPRRGESAHPGVVKRNHQMPPLKKSRSLGLRPKASPRR